MCCRDNREEERAKLLLAVPQNQLKLKVCIVGDAGVGKTCLLHRFCGSEYPGDGVVCTTVGTDIFLTEVMCSEEEQLQWGSLVKDGSLPVQLCDTAGQERFAVLVGSQLRHATAVIMVFSTEDTGSLQQLLEYWYSDVVLPTCRDQLGILVVGNKSDVQAETLHQEELLGQLCQRLESHGEMFSCVETSAKADPGARQIFEAFIKRIASRVVAEKKPA